MKDAAAEKRLIEGRITNQPTTDNARVKCRVRSDDPLVVRAVSCFNGAEHMGWMRERDEGGGAF